MFSDPLRLALTIAAIPLAILVLLTLNLSGHVRKLAAGRARLTPLDPDDLPPLLEACQDEAEWGEANAYELHEAFRYEVPGNALSVEILLYAAASGCDFYGVYRFNNRVLTDLIAIRTLRDTGGAVGVTTGSARDGLTFPKPPSEFIQAFEHIDRDSRARAHADAVEHVEAELPLDRLPVGLAPDELLLHSIRADAAHVTTLPLWFVRTPWWYLVSRNRLVNRSIVREFPAGHPRFALAARIASPLPRSSSLPPA